MEIRHASGLGMKPVDIGRVDYRVSVSRDVAVSHVIDEDDDDVGLACCGGNSLDTKEQAECYRSELFLHWVILF